MNVMHISLNQLLSIPLLNPTSATQVTLLGTLNHIHSVPPQVTQLCLKKCPDFNQPLLSSCPPFLTSLKLGDIFNQSVDNLPQSLTELHLGKYFDQPADYLPSSLTKLHLCSDDFNHHVDHLPNSLLELILGIHLINLLTIFQLHFTYLNLIFLVTLISPLTTSLHTSPTS
jgi:hypothetical protein